MTSAISAITKENSLAANKFKNYLMQLAAEKNPDWRAYVHDDEGGTLSFAYGFNYGAVTPEKVIIFEDVFKGEKSTDIVKVAIEANAADLYKISRKSHSNPASILTHSDLFNALSEVGKSYPLKEYLESDSFIPRSQKN